MQYPWIQERHTEGTLGLHKVKGEWDPADMLTKGGPKEILNRHFRASDFEPRRGEVEATGWQVSNVARARLNIDRSEHLGELLEYTCSRLVSDICDLKLLSRDVIADICLIYQKLPRLHCSTSTIPTSNPVVGCLNLVDPAMVWIYRGETIPQGGGRIDRSNRGHVPEDFGNFARRPPEYVEDHYPVVYGNRSAVEERVSCDLVEEIGGRELDESTKRESAYFEGHRRSVESQHVCRRKNSSEGMHKDARDKLVVARMVASQSDNANIEKRRKPNTLGKMSVFTLTCFLYVSIRLVAHRSKGGR